MTIMEDRNDGRRVQPSRGWKREKPAVPDIRIPFAGLGGDLLDERIDVLDVGSDIDIDALRATMMFP